jgi:hypothetical protein
LSGPDALFLGRHDVERQDGSTAPFIVIDTDILSSGMPSNSVRMS